MSASLTDKQRCRQLIRTQACLRKDHEMALGRPSVNLIVASELALSGVIATPAATFELL
jgi:hypothetical protein